MAQTSTQTPTGVRQNRTVGRWLDTGTVAPIVIVTGFKPRSVKVLNLTSGDEYEWHEGMAAASAFKRLANGTAALITTLGITVSDSGFTIGLDLDINVASEQLSWIAES